jgi:hypothetical protein
VPVASLIFLTPSAGLVALFGVAPLAALALGVRRVGRVRALLRLDPPGTPGVWLEAVALAATAVVIALAAMQPALRSHGSERVRRDVGVFVVIDVSSSMDAAAGPHAASRLTQAKRLAIAIGTGITGIPVGVATFTDRVLPNLFPTVDTAAFSSTVRSLRVGSPPPREQSRVATDFGPLAAVRRSGFFVPAQKRRALVLITDGESGPFDGSVLGRALAAQPAVHLLVLRVGGGGDRLYRSDGAPGGSYRADPAGARRAIAQLVSVTGGHTYTSAAAAAGALRSLAGSGLGDRVQTHRATSSLAPYVALASLLPVFIVLRNRNSAKFPATRRLF